MKYCFLVISRWFYTGFCKISAKTAEIICFWWVISILDWSMKQLEKALGEEAVYCMNITRKWQKRAERCVMAHHEFEKGWKAVEK